LEQFSGPLDKLLELIESRKLEITQISLAEVTGDFLRYVQHLSSGAELRVIADFLRVAAQLILIKSRVLLPSFELAPEETYDIENLERRLKLYKEFKETERLLQRLWGAENEEFSRTLFSGRQPSFYPPKNFEAQDLLVYIKKIAEALRELTPLDTEKIKIELASVEEKVQEILNRISSAAELKFSGIAKDKSKEEIIVLFLAILHLLKDRLVNIEQSGIFSDIIIRTKNQ
jgi:segregation and condensation protein A